MELYMRENANDGSGSCLKSAGNLDDDLEM
jgi:hypothetical protein